jgi:hypothetical protein
MTVEQARHPQEVKSFTERVLLASAGHRSLQHTRTSLGRPPDLDVRATDLDEQALIVSSNRRTVDATRAMKIGVLLAGAFQDSEYFLPKFDISRRSVTRAAVSRVRPLTPLTCPR